MASNARMDSPVGNSLGNSTDAIAMASPRTGGTPVKIDSPVDGAAPRYGNVDLNFGGFPNLTVDLPRDGKSGLQTPMRDTIKGSPTK